MKSTSLSDTLRAFRNRLPAQARLYIPGCSGEPLAVIEEFRKHPDLVEGVTFLGIWIPGVNTTDWAGLSATTRAESVFVSPALRPSFKAGATRFLPLSYTQSTRWLGATRLDGAIVMISPPDASGHVSLGVSADFSTLVMDRQNVPVLGIINNAMTAPKHGPKIPMDRFSALVEAEHALLQVDEADLPDTFAQIGHHIASLCEPGDTLQFGLGNVQQAALRALSDHHELRIHAGMISTPLLDLLDKGVIASMRNAITTGVAIGSQALYERVVDEDRITFAPVSHTHAMSTLAAIRNFKAINSCIEVDLFGQANAEFLNGRQISGTGGLVDFLRGAQVSDGGRGILALASTAKDGTISRIVPRLPADATSIARADIETVITEHGIADLRYKSMDQRAAALVEIADPAFRDQLSRTWHEMRKGF